MNHPKKHITLYTDGACSGNPGPGGWGCLLIYKDKQKTLSGGEKQTTNNQMELTAVIEGLSLLKESCLVDLYTDSKYVLEGATRWLDGWIQKGWKKADKKPVLNVEYWQKLLPLLQKHTINWHWVKGHAGHPQNELVDQLACTERDNFANQ
jgi:ribonuclease HI